MGKFRCPICGRSVKNMNEHFARYHPEDYSQKSQQDNVKITYSGKYDNKNKKSNIIVVDGQNVASYREGRPLYRNLFLIYKSLKIKGYLPKIVISAAMKYRIDNPVKLHLMLDKGIAIESPAGENDDLTVLELAQKHGAKIVSNDSYIDHQEIFQDISNKTIKFNIDGDRVVFTPHLP